MSGTVFVRPGAPARPALTAGDSTPAPRPWAAALPRPAARILLAGGLTLAGWLLGAALSGNTASAAETTTCTHPAVSTVEQGKHGHHRTSHRETGAATCAQQPKTGDDTKQQAETPADQTKTDQTNTDETQADQTQTDQNKTDENKTVETQTVESPAAGKQSLAKQSTKDEEPAAKATTSGSGLLGGLVGSVLNVVGGTLTTVTNTVGVVTHTVGAVTDTLSHTVLAPLTQPPADNPDAPVLLPLDDVLGPILNGGSNSGGVTATVPDAVTGVVTSVTATTGTAPATAPATAETQTGGRIAVVHLVEVQNTLPAVQEQPRDSGVHARNGGGDSTPGLPGGGTTAPSAPAPTAAPGHDGSGGARPQFAVHTDDVTTTQLKLIGASRDHDVDGAGREAALPTTSPD